MPVIVRDEESRAVAVLVNGVVGRNSPVALLALQATTLPRTLAESPLVARISVFRNDIQVELLLTASEACLGLKIAPPTARARDTLDFLRILGRRYPSISAQRECALLHSHGASLPSMVNGTLLHTATFAARDAREERSSRVSDTLVRGPWCFGHPAA